MKDEILHSLKEIEKDYGVKILYACESGSRAWGFPSKYSDYDVRFIYVHKREDYLMIDPIGVGKKRDVIERPIHALLDISGWELTKALRLFRKSNPPMLEWLHSVIVYYQAYSTVDKMRELSKTIFSPLSCICHYLNMADRNFRRFLQEDVVKSKKYFYVLRPVLAAQWIEKYNEFPPVEFSTLLAELVPESELKNEIDLLIQRKITGNELAGEQRIGVIHEFLEKEIERLRDYAKTLPPAKRNFTTELDKLFRGTLEEVWDK